MVKPRTVNESTMTMSKSNSRDLSRFFINSTGLFLSGDDQIPAEIGLEVLEDFFG